MNIIISQWNNASLVTISGRIDSDTSPEVSRAFQELQEAGRYNIAVDMSGLEYLSSAALRALMSAQRNSRRFNRGQVVLLKVPENILDVLEVAGLLDLYTRVDDLEALATVPGFEPPASLSTDALPA